MLTVITAQVGFWIVLATVLMTIGSYILLTKQNSSSNSENSKQIRVLGEKMDKIGNSVEINQVKTELRLEHLNDKTNKIEHDTAATRAQLSMLSEAITKIKVRQNLRE